MSSDFKLIGKTITGIVGTPAKGDKPGRIWMLQFSDGTHVEFVSPSARRRLIKAASGCKHMPSRPKNQADAGANAA